MLNKLNFFKNKKFKTQNKSFDEARIASSKETISILERYFKCKYDNVLIRPMAGGTLSFIYQAELGGNFVFIKVAFPSEEYTAALYKESIILPEVNSSLKMCKYVSFGGIHFLLIDFFEKSIDPKEPKYFKSIIESYQRKLLEFTANNVCFYDITVLLEIAKKELQNLCFSKETFYLLNSIFNTLQGQLNNQTRIICHGDLCEKNIMMNKNDDNCILDWEDSFLGVQDYDFYYWLTFFNNRKYYNSEIIGKNREEKEYHIALMCMILVIKEAIYFYSGNNTKRSLTCEERIKEVLQLWTAKN